MQHLPMIALWALGIIWGSNFIFMKHAVEYLTPLQVVFFRILFGFLPVLVYAGLSGRLKREHLKYTHHFLVMALLAAAIYYYGFVKGSELLLSGIAGALSGVIPLVAFVLAVIFLPGEKASPAKVTGLIIGVLGVVLIANPFESAGASTNWQGVFYMVMGAVSLGISFVYAKKFIMPLQIPSVALACYQLGIAVVLMFFITDLEGSQRILEDKLVLVEVMIGLGLLGTGVAYIAYYYIVDKLGATTASSSTFIPPVVAMIIGVFLVGEEIRPVDYLATLMILGGMMLLNNIRIPGRKS